MKLGVVLSGGGAKGAYEAGFLKALSEFNIQPNAIAGTSIGALNGAIYSANKNTKEAALILEKIWRDLANSSSLQVDETKVIKNLIEVILYFSPLAPVSKVTKLASYLLSNSIGKGGILSTEPLSNVLEKYASIEKLLNGLPLYVGVTQSGGNLIDTLRLFELENGGFTEYKKIQDLEKDYIYKTILASAALPIAFDSQEIDGKKYRDGCLSSLWNEWGNTPIKPLIEKENCTHLVVCHLNEASFFNRHDSFFKEKNVEIIEIRPKYGTFNYLDPLIFSVDKIDMWIEQGYKDSKKALQDSLGALNRKYERIYHEEEGKIVDEKLKNFSFNN